MRYTLLALVTLLVASGATVRADDAPEPPRALAGEWVRSGLLTTKEGKQLALPALAPTKDGTDYVSPELRFIAKGKSWQLVVSGTPPIVYWNPLPPVYDLVVPVGAKLGTLAVVVPDRGLKRRAHFEYTIEKDTLTIVCKEKVPAGPWLGDYNISGTWVRAGKTSGSIK